VRSPDTILKRDREVPLVQFWFDLAQEQFKRLALAALKIQIVI
jgi:hypothetical protein